MKDKRHLFRADEIRQSVEQFLRMAVVSRLHAIALIIRPAIMRIRYEDEFHAIFP
jgi:hypothetical protein